MISCCGYCPHNGNAILTTYPPKIRCELTGKLHYTKDSCDIYDIVAVVRCKDCIYYGDHGDGEMACAMMILYPNKPTDYCSLGERKENAID